MRIYPFALSLAALICLLAAGCNKNEDEEVEQVQYSNTAITSFNLTKDNDVLRDLNTVFFSIDLVHAEIFNADSLPMGTDVSSLGVEIGTAVLSAATISYKDNNGAEQTVNYLADNNVKVNFANGPAILNVTSYDGTTSRSYTITVNVHQTDADLLYWNQAARATLPTILGSTITASKTVDFNEAPAVLTTDGSNYCLALCEDIEQAVWTYITPDFSTMAPDVATFTAANNVFYIISNGILYKSEDGGQSWVSTNTPMDWIYAIREEAVIGNVESNGSYMFASYPSSGGGSVPTDMPVRGTSQAITYSNEWMTAPTTSFVGGIKADGSRSGDTWSFDGTSWMRTNITSIPEATGVTLFPYFVYRTSSSSWRTTKLSAFYAVGGETADGTLSRTIYTSTDFGAHWLVAPDALQLPEVMASFAGADALVYPTMLYASRAGAGAWIPEEGTKLQQWMISATRPASRAVAPITEWECPYIYLFGGKVSDGSVNDAMWRGVINRLTFIPLQ